MPDRFQDSPVGGGLEGPRPGSPVQQVRILFVVSAHSYVRVVCANCPVRVLANITCAGQAGVGNQHGLVCRFYAANASGPGPMRAVEAEGVRRVFMRSDEGYREMRCWGAREGHPRIGEGLPEGQVEWHVPLR